MTTITFADDVKGQISNEFDFLLSENELKRHLRPFRHRKQISLTTKVRKRRKHICLMMINSVSKQRLYVKLRSNLISLLSTDEGSFVTRILVAICLLYGFSKYQWGQIQYHNLHLFVKNKASIWTSTRFHTYSERIFDLLESHEFLL